MNDVKPCRVSARGESPSTAEEVDDFQFKAPFGFDPEVFSVPRVNVSP